MLYARTYYWRSFAHSSEYSNWEGVVFWKAGTTLTPMVNLAHCFYLIRVMCSVIFGPTQVATKYMSWPYYTMSFSWLMISIVFAVCIAWAWNEALLTGRLYYISLVSVICNIIVLVIDLCALVAIPWYNYWYFTSNHYIKYYWSAYGLNCFSCLICIFFVNHNDLFEMLGYTGVPRDMLAYVSIIWGTGIADLLQTLASIGFVILMGVFYY